jgi:hypothetical protein
MREPREELMADALPDIRTVLSDARLAMAPR